jgi:hypothetical protein
MRERMNRTVSSIKALVEAEVQPGPLA